MLAAGESTVAPVEPTDDMKATIRAARALGASVEEQGDALRIRGLGAGAPPAHAVIDCGESGSTLRFFVPVAAALGVPALFQGRGKLPARPLGPLTGALESHGVSCVSPGREHAILEIDGRLRAGRFALPGDVSSQYITGLLFAAPLLAGDSELLLTSPLQSGGYVEMTLAALAQASIRVEPVRDGWRIPGGQRFRAGVFGVEGDYSSAAFWLCAGALGEPVEVSGLREDSVQGDRAVLALLGRFGAQVRRDGGVVRVAPGALRGIDIDIAQIPDLAPALAVVAACAEGQTVIRGAARLRLKESDRIRSICAGLEALGAEVREREDAIVIQGRETLRGGVADSFADHRIAMAMSIASVRCRGPVTVTGAESVAKSYPDFYRQLRSLGGDYRVV